MDLVFYNVRAVAVITALDLGDAAPASSDDTMLRVANTSDLYLAKDVTVSTAGPDALQLWLSTDGDTFGTSIKLGNVPPGGFSSIFWLRRVTPSDADGTGQAALSAIPASWSSNTDTTTSDNVALETD